MKIGRNDFCPCGSGKKYKHCCMALVAPTPEQQVWRRLRDELQGLPKAMLEFTLENYGGEALDEAWQSFYFPAGEEEGRFDPESILTPMFLTWLLHGWEPAPDETGLVDPALSEVRPTVAFLARRGQRLSPLLRDYLGACLDSPLCFYEVEQCRPGQGFRLRDVFTGSVREVFEASASRSARNGDMLYAQVVSVAGIHVLEALSPIKLPPICKIDLIEQRERMRAPDGSIPADYASRWELELHGLFLGLTLPLLDPKMPVLQNTDGEPLELRRLRFEVDSGEQAFAKLSSLQVDVPAEHRGRAAERDAGGRLLRAEFAWARLGNALHPEWENTVLGNIVIADGQLTVEVNSRERARQFRQIIAERLGDAARFCADEAPSSVPEPTDVGAADEATPHGPGVVDTPEAKAAVAHMLAKHYANWAEIPMPALGGRTPMAAMADAGGREQVEVLVDHVERASLRMDVPGLADIFLKLRRRLGLVASE